jgi:hypothetical protein
MSSTVNLDLPMKPGKAPPTFRQLAGKVAKDSIVTQALERLIEQIVQICAEHETASVAALRAQNTELAAALEEARGWVQDEVNADPRHRGGDVLARIDAALAAARQPQERGEWCNVARG